ncbi:MAG TPA: iron ABC transporter permease [Candidatus Cloacimonadota bacterium]|nr:iron ABC transporter permease [Candidatus Cloacimonadota bacterium]
MFSKKTSCQFTKASSLSDFQIKYHFSQSGSLQNRLLLILPLAFLVVFFYYPLLFILKKAFYSNGIFSFDIIKNVLTQPWQQSVILFTFKQAVYSLFLTILIGLPITFILTNYDFPGKKLIKAICMIPFVLPGITVALGFILFYGQQGFINQFLSLLNLKVSVLYSLKAILLAHAFYNVPLFIKMLGDTLENFNKHLIIAARTLGKNKFQTFVKVIIPCITPSLLNVSLLIFLYCFMSFGIVLVLGDVKYTTIEVNIYILVKHLLETEKGIALSFVQILMSVVMLNLSYYFSRKQAHISGMIRGSENFVTPLFKQLNIIKILSITTLILFMIFTIAPLLSIFVFAFKNYSSYLSELFQYDPIIGSNMFQPVLNSLVLGLLVSFFSVGISLMFRISLSGFKYRRLIENLILLPLGISGITFSLGYLFLFSQANIKPFILLIIAQTIICLPFSYSSVSNAIDGIHANIVYSAQSLGAGFFKVHSKVIIPLIINPIITALMFSFAISLGEISSASMLADGFVTIPVGIYRYISARQFASATNMSLILILTALIVFTISERLKYRKS